MLSDVTWHDVFCLFLRRDVMWHDAISLHVMLPFCLIWCEATWLDFMWQCLTLSWMTKFGWRWQWWLPDCFLLIIGHPVLPLALIVAVLGVVWPGEDGASCVLQGSGGSRGSWEPVLCGEQAAGHPPLWGERLCSTLAEPRLGEGEAASQCWN